MHDDLMFEWFYNLLDLMKSIYHTINFDSGQLHITDLFEITIQEQTLYLHILGRNSFTDK